MPKILVSGDVGGNLEELYKRVSVVNSKSGPFECLLCTGEFFGSADVGGEDDEQPNYVDHDPIRPYKRGEKEAPLPTYFICGKEWGPSLDQTSSFQEVAKNIFFLGNHGIRDLFGLRIAFMSGHFPLQALGTLETMQSKSLTGMHDASNPVDILLTAQWPAAVCSMLQGSAPPDVRGQPIRQVGTSAASVVAKSLTPRYHFVGSEHIFYERPPYISPPCNNNPGTVRHISRFFALAQVGNPDKKQRWLYAANVTAVRDMTPDALNSQPPNTTPSPYAPPTPQATGFLKGSNLSMSMGTGANAIGSGGGAAAPAGFSATICHVANLPYAMTDDSMVFAFAQFGEVARVHLARDADTKKLRGFGFVEFKSADSARKAVAATGFDVGGRQVRVSFAPEKDGGGGGKRAAGGAGGEAPGAPAAKKQMFEKHPLLLRSDDCWFCLSSPKCEKHLVVSVGEEVYVALAKGPLVPEHVLIIPISHIPAGNKVPDNVWAEVELYKRSLEECFRKERQSGLLLYERATQTSSPHSHCHFQAIPLPDNTEAAACAHIRAAGAPLNIEFIPKPTWRDDEEIEQYVWFEVPSQKSFLFHQVPPRQRHPLNFCREVASRLLKMPHRADWKDCALSLDQESKMAADFKKLFAPYDWSLRDD